MPINFSDFIVHGKSDNDLLSIPVNEQTGTFSIQVQDGSLGGRILRWLKGERAQTNVNQLRAAEELFHSVLDATGNDAHRTNLILKSAGVRISKPISVRQVKKVIAGLGLTKQDYGTKGAPLAPTRAHGHVAITPTAADTDRIGNSIAALKPDYELKYLNRYGKQINEALKKQVAADDAGFGEQVADLMEGLSDLEDEFHDIIKDIEAGTITGSPAEILALKNDISAVRKRIEDTLHNVNNASNARLYGTLDTTGNWNRVLYWQSAGIDYDQRLIEPLFEGKTVDHAIPLGQGALNSVSRVFFTDASIAAFKPIQFQYARLNVNAYLGVSGSQPRNEVRNVAATRISEALGFNLMPKCGVGIVNGDQGLLMEVVNGETAGKIGTYPVRDPHGSAIHRRDELIDSPRAMKDINNLEVLDAILGMLDRHEGNWIIQEDAAGNYAGIKAIDNDQTLQNATVDLERVIGPRPRDFFDANDPQDRERLSGVRNTGLPMVIDADTARTVLDPQVRERAFAAVSGMLEPKALEDLGKRWDTLAKHITERLEPQGRVIDNWNDRYDEVKAILNANVEHSLWGRAVLSNDEIRNLLIMER
jgi:hypothetical protein